MVELNKVNAAADSASKTQSSTPAQKTVPTRKSALPRTAPTNEPPASIASNLRQTDVLFRRDRNGQIYYVVTDAQSGKELQELPPEEIRKVKEGIADYLREAQEKSAHGFDAKA